MSTHSLVFPLVYGMTLLLFCWLGTKLPQIRKLTWLDRAVALRQSPIDGLRGILATSVFAYHFYITYGFANTGKWISPTLPLLANMGAVPVSLFFMITGYLFLRKVNQPTTDWFNLYLGRVKRIYPLYVLLAMMSAVIFAIQHQFELDISVLVIWLAKWLRFEVPPLAGFYAKPLIIGAVWTLIYEWAFYSILPMLALLRHPQHPWSVQQIIFALLTAAIALYLFNQSIAKLYLLFVLAIVPVYFAAQFKTLLQRFTPLCNGVLPFFALGIMVYTKPYSTVQMLLLALLFGFIVNGYDFAKVLQHPTLKFLGEISYSIYLMHGVVIYTVLLVLPSFAFRLPMIVYEMTLPLVLLLTILLAMLTHHYVEKPFYQTKIR